MSFMDVELVFYTDKRTLTFIKFSDIYIDLKPACNRSLKLAAQGLNVETLVYLYIKYLSGLELQESEQFSVTNPSNFQSLELKI